MNWIYYLMGALILGAYGLIWYLRVRRARNVARYEQTLRQAPHPDEAGYTPGLPADVTRDMVQNCTASGDTADADGQTGAADDEAANGETDVAAPADGAEKERQI